MGNSREFSVLKHIFTILFIFYAKFQITLKDMIIHHSITITHKPITITIISILARINNCRIKSKQGLLKLLMPMELINNKF